MGGIVIDRVVVWSLAVAVAGFLFGFDTAVISGADQPLQRLWETSDLFHGAFVMSSALWGTVIGALLGNIPSDRLGRRRTLVGVGLLYLASAAGCAGAPGPGFFAAMRFVGGLGVGISSIVVPAYISEVAPPGVRGRLVALYQFQIVVGILVAFLSNFVLSEYLLLDWRWMLGVEGIPAAAFLAMITRVPESPRWLLLHRGDEAASRRVLAVCDPERVDETVAEIRLAQTDLPDRHLFRQEYRKPILLAFSVALFNQLSGINFIIYFAPRVFELAGLDSSASLLSTAGVGLVNLVTTVVGMYLIDRAGRRFLLLIGSVGYIVSLGAVSWAFGSDAGGAPVVLFVFLFIASHAVGQGAVIWVWIAEIFPNSVRARGQSLGSGTHWVAAASIALLMPYFLGRFQPQDIFAFFCAMMVLQLLFVLFLMPETRGRTLESLADELSGSRPGR